MMRYDTREVAAFMAEAFARAHKRGKRGLAAARTVDRAVKRRFPKLLCVQLGHALDLYARAEREQGGRL
jgi:hypothetical protein